MERRIIRMGEWQLEGYCSRAAFKSVLREPVKSDGLGFRIIAEEKDEREITSGQLVRRGTSHKG